MSGSLDSLRNAIKYSRVALGVFLILAIIGLPYDFYNLLRVFGFVVFLLSSYEAYRDTKAALTIIWLTSAIAINPLFPIVMSRFTWQIIDAVWVVIIIYDYAFKSKK